MKLIHSVMGVAAVGVSSVLGTKTCKDFCETKAGTCKAHPEAKGRPIKKVTVYDKFYLARGIEMRITISKIS